MKDGRTDNGGSASAPGWARRYLLPVTLVVAAVGGAYLLRPLVQVLLALFAGILLAIFLDGCTALLRRFLPLRRGIVLGIVLVVLCVLGLGLFWLAGAQLAQQAARLLDQLPAAVATARTRVMENDWLRALYERLAQGGSGARQLLGNLGTVFSSTFGVLGHLVLIVFTGIYVAIHPEAYSGALLRLLPPARRGRGQEVLAALGEVLRYWLVGRLASMTVVGVLTAIGLLLIGQPLALILGVIAGILSFIPFLGPLLAAVPALLVGFTESPAMAAWVALVFAVVQFIESNLITPLIEKKAVMVPPAFVIAGQFLMGTLAAFYGVLLATPLLVLFTVLIQMLYIQDVLGDPVPVLGDRD